MLLTELRRFKWQSTEVFFCLAYLLIPRGCLYDIIHEGWHQLCYSIHSCSVGTVLGSVVDGLAMLFRLVHPLASYRVYDIENT